MKNFTTAIFLFIALCISFSLRAQKAFNSNEPALQLSIIDSEIQLSWTTTREINTSYFVVETSPDSIHFTALKTVQAAGSSLFANTYHYSEISTETGNYYRVTLVDMNGERSSSAIIKLPSSLMNPVTVK